VDVTQGQIERLSLWSYLNYQLNLFTLLAGPIERYQSFRADWDCLLPVLPDQHAVLRAYLRVFIGMIKVAYFAKICLFWYEFMASRLDVLSVAAEQGRAWNLVSFLILFYSYPLYMYFNFSGYCDIVIGAASLVGLRLPENFNLWFISRNLIEYWTRWHMTLGRWIRDYVFTPLYKALVERWPQRAVPLAIACYFVAFFLTGVWHGSTWNFVVYGLLNGAGVSIAKLWEMIIVKRRGRSGLRAYLQSPVIRFASTAITFHYICLTTLFFPGELGRSLRIVGNVFYLGTRAGT
jgi:D-alanyl-lipoteichoic acid acyltransferase DltB (MBOAT superfamily)